MEKPSLIKKLSAETTPEQRLGIFVKEPIAGRVKTRLCPPLQPAEAAQLYRVAMRETIERFSAGPVPVVLFYDGSVEYFAKNFPGLRLQAQVDGDLGQRMNAALTTLLDSGCRAAALIGSDSPDLPLAQVEAAFAALAEHDLATIPAGDGGYVLIGSSRRCPEVFGDLPWSTAGVLTATRRLAEQHALRYCERGGWEDIDDGAGLAALVSRSPGSATARFIREHLPHALERA